MVHAFEWLGDGQRWLWLGVLFVVVCGLGAALKVQGRSLEKAGASILVYEFAWDREGAARVLGRWCTPALRETARNQLLLDFPFLLVYPLFLSLACAMLPGAPENAMAGVGIFLSWAVLAALPLDAVENLALLACSRTSPTTPSPASPPWPPEPSSPSSTPAWGTSCSRASARSAVRS